MKAKRLLLMVTMLFGIVHLSIFNFQFSIGSAFAQPAKRRTTTSNAAAQRGAAAGQQKQTADRASLMFPTADEMPEDVVWRRDIYRELDLNDDANAGLYYPVQPQGKQLNLFTYIFKLAQNGYLPIYEYSVANDGNDDFSDAAKVKLKTVLDNYHIFYEEKDGKLKIDNSDIPSAEVLKYFLKESAYYDQSNATFHIKPLALCPVMVREDDFGGESAQYPLFWIKYSDLEPFLSRQTVMTSNVNNAAVMSMDDYFTLNKYKGKIYKTNNMLGKSLAQIAGGDTAKLSQEQQRIEAELEAFRKNIYGDRQKKDSLDSVADTKADLTKAAKKERKAKAEKADKAEKASSRRTKAAKSSSGSSSAARVSVRRQRH